MQINTAHAFIYTGFLLIDITIYVQLGLIALIFVIGLELIGLGVNRLPPDAFR